MNELKKAMVRGLYKEAGVKEVIESLKNNAVKAKDFAVNTYKKNPEAWKRAGIDTAGAAGMNIIGLIKDRIMGQKTTGTDVLVRSLLGVAGAEAGQYGYKKYQDMAARAGDPAALAARDEAVANQTRKLVADEQKAQQEAQAKDKLQADTDKANSDNARDAKLWRDQEAKKKADAEAKAKAQAAKDKADAEAYRRQQKEQALENQKAQENKRQKAINKRLSILNAIFAPIDAIKK
jgi:flagellar biosynthesis GTPase FlhF